MLPINFTKTKIFFSQLLTFENNYVMITIEYESNVILRFGLAEKPWSTERRGISPPLFISAKGSVPVSKILSIFIDESGDFGSLQLHSPYYLVTMILHNQDVDISENIKSLESHLHNLNFDFKAVHTGPIIRREEIYKNMTMEERKRIFHALFNFARRLEFKYICTFVDKNQCDDVIKMTSKLSRNIASTISDNSEFFNSFDRIIIYYDNGQVELTKIITSVFNAIYSNVDFRKVSPIDYKLFQVADLLCSLELLSLKAETKSFSKSEKEFFCSVRDFKKNYLKPVLKKKL